MGQWSNRTIIDSRLDSTTLDEGRFASRADVNYESYASFAVANLTAASHTVALAAMNDGAGIHNIRRARVVALRLSGGRFADYASAVSDSESSTTSTSFVEKLSKTWTSGGTGDWLILGSGRMNCSSSSGQVENQFQYNNATTLATQVRTVQATNEYKTMACVAVQNVAAGGRQADIDYRTSNASYTAYAAYGHLVMLPLGTSVSDLVVTTTSLPNGQIGVAYSQTLQATGGQTPYSWSTVGGTLPAGLTLSSGGVISGTPTTAGTSNFTVRATDSQGTPDTDDQALSITIPANLVITTASLPGGTVGTAYSQTLAATGGVTAYSWSVVSGSLPAGLSLGSSTGAISGTPTTANTYNFTVRVTDSQSPADTDDQALSIVVTAGVQDLVITTTTLPGGTVGAAYSQTIAATGGVAPYSWSISSGTLPSGLSIGSSTGVISGTPTTAGTSNFTVRVQDSQGTPDSDTQALSIVISAADLQITTTTLAGGTVGTAYSQTVVATGGVTPYGWSISSGTLPSGLTIGSTTGVISGTPTTAGTSNFTVRVQDSQGTPDTDTQALSITISAADLQIATASLPSGTVGVAYSQTVAATGGVTPYSLEHLERLATRGPVDCFLYGSH